MTTVIVYLDDMIAGELEYKEALLWWQKKGLMYTATGYGKKIPTTRKVKYNNRWYRVYCMIYSNAGSIYIVSEGEKLYIRS